MDDMVTSREEMLNSDNFCASYPELPVLNLTDPVVASRYEYKPFPAALVAAIYPGIALLGLTTNLLFLLTVYRVKSMRTLTNAYLSNLAISDVMFLSTGAAFGFWKYVSTPVTSDFSILGGVHGCFLTQQANAIPVFASTLMVSAVTIERYLAICHPLRHLKFRSKRRTTIIIASTWFVSMCLAAMLFPSTRNYYTLCVMWPDDKYFVNFPGLISYCGGANDNWSTVLAFCGLTIPFIVEIVVCFALFFLILRKLSVRIGGIGNNASDNNNSKNTRDRVAKMLVITGVTIFILLTPRTVVTIYYYIKVFTGVQGFSPDTETILFISTNLLVYVNSVVNPIIYAFANERYRAAFLEAVRCCPRRSRSNSSLGLHEDYNSKTQTTNT
ncbi:somatostatin receptor type 5-like [Asterias amurensis]|uniref:somatostatin receptor type 5-like n=1 Tax=Asterias amurensis TaxID=7602 RepID=UPI003AB3C216